MSPLKRLCPLILLALMPAVCASSAAALDPDLSWDDEPNELSWEHFASCRHCFAQFSQWWQALPEAERTDALRAAREAELIAPEPELHTRIVIQGEAFAGEGWEARSFRGRECIVGPYGHTRATARYTLDVPEAVRYRLWLRWWNDPAYHNTITVRVRPEQVSDYTYRWQSSVDDPLLSYRFGFAPTRHTERPLDYPVDQEGFIWDAAPRWVELPEGRVVLELTGAIHRGPYTSRAVDSLMLTQDPFHRPDERASWPDSDPDEPSTRVRITREASEADSEAAWRRWSIRPAVVPPHTAPRSLAAQWRAWRRALIERLAEDEPATDHEAYLVHRFYFDERWNLVGMPSQVAGRIAELEAARERAGGYWDWIEAADFDIAEGWAPVSRVNASQGRALRAGYTNGHAEASTRLDVPADGRYRLWVRFARIRDYYNHFDLSVAQAGETIERMEHREIGPEGHGGGYRFVWKPIDLELEAGEAVVTLTKNRGRSPYAYRFIDCILLTDNLAFEPEGTQRPAWPSAHRAPEALEAAGRAGRAGRALAWLGAGEDHWDGFAMTDWPTHSHRIATEDAVTIEQSVGAVESRVLHLTNPGETPITLTPRVTAGEGLLDWRLVIHQLSARYGWQPSALFQRHAVTIPPRTTATLWLSFDGRGRSAGTHAATLQFGDQEVRFDVRLAGPDISDAPGPLVGGWCDPHPSRHGWAQFADIGLNILHRRAIPKAEMEAYGIRLQMLSLGEPESEDEVRDRVAALEAMGLDYEDWTWQIHDEPTERTYERWIEAAEIIRSADPNVRIWCNPGEHQRATAEAVTAMAPYIDVFCPYLNHFGTDDPAYAQRLPTIGEVHLLYTTPCFNEFAPAAPREWLSVAAAARRHGRDGWNGFSLRNDYLYANTAWDDVHAFVPDQAISIYPGAWDRAIGSRNLEAVRHAIQQWKHETISDRAR